MRRTQLVVLLAAILVSAFGILVDAAAEGDGVTAVDGPVASGVLHVRSPFMTACAQVLTLAGSEVVVSALALGLMVLLVNAGRLVHAASAAMAMAGSAALTLGVKDAVGRARPPAVDRLGPVDHSYSFPSGHTLNSAVLIGLAVMFLLPSAWSRTRRVLAGIVATILAIAIGASRVYLGYHWATDVAASWLLAVAWLIAIGGLTAILVRHTPAFLQPGPGQVDPPTPVR